MKAVVKIAPAGGPAGTEVRECARPIPAAGEVLIRVAAAAICGTDKHIYHWDPSIRDSFETPRIYGHEFCGFVEELGPSVGRTDIRPGDYVSAEMHVVCGECARCRTGNGHICPRTRILGLHGDGAFAELVRVPAANVIRLDPRWVPVEVGAFLDALGNAVHSTQVVDLAGRSVAITGFGPIGAMAAAIAEHSGASQVIVTDISDHALETARRWAARKTFANLHAFNVRSTDLGDMKTAIAGLTDGGVDVVLEMSGAAAAINLGLEVLRPGGFMSILGLPAGHSVRIEDYTRNVVFKGITIQGIIGRRMFETWDRMLSLLRSGLDVGWVVQAEYDSLEGFHDGIARFDRHEALKVVLYPQGKAAASERIAGHGASVAL
ncbi:MAG TPA: alcohol dehydrogenase catalytic domain-containing protein [Thermoanaerobaculia bacterium]|nr:alcohol dehydrogenase catalytic domain-containing protein [Thermoanaerobaculia bacterium]